MDELKSEVIEKLCEFCGVKFYPLKFDTKTLRNFSKKKCCSNKCSRAYVGQLNIKTAEIKRANKVPEPIPDNKRCSNCKKVKPLSEFGQCKTGKHGVYNYCSPCHNEYQLKRHPNRNKIDEKEARKVGLKKLGLKTCSSCKSVKPYDEFYGDPRHSDGKQSHCIDCCNQMQDKNYLRREYGLAIEQITMLMDFQDGRCAICRRPPKNYKFNIDHCHKTHRVRALLCVNCNTNLLPYVEQFPEWIAKAIEYLKDPPAFAVVGEIFVPETNQSRVRERRKLEKSINTGESPIT